MQIELTKENVKLIGRTLKIEDVLWCALSGTGAAFTFTGKKLTVTILGGLQATLENNEGNYARIAFYVNGRRVLEDMVTTAEKTYTICDNKEEKRMDVQIIKLSESAMSVIGIRDLEIADNESVEPLPEKARKIEFIGDSITCGYGVDCEDPLIPFTTATEDVTRAFAYKTAKALDADYSMFSASGYGIISGYTADPDVKSPEQLIPLYYHSLGFSYDTFLDGKNTTKIDWNFADYQPDTVVINLGTNDDSYCQDTVEKQKEYAVAYTRFLKDVRSKNPEAKIVCVLGIMGARLYPLVEKAVAEYTKETGDGNVCTLELPEQDIRYGYASDYHPIERAHDVAAAVLTRALQ